MHQPFSENRHCTTTPASSKVPPVYEGRHGLHAGNTSNVGGTRPASSLLQAKLRVNQPGDSYEREADRVADKVIRMSDAQVAVTSSSPMLQRQPSQPAAITISKGVGAKGPNIVSDLKVIQDRLVDTGFLLAADKAAEGDTLLKDLKDTDKVDADKIPKTIAAIKEYERVVLYKTSSTKYNKPTGQISPGSDAITLMNAQIANPTTTELTAITTNRAALSATVVEGKLALSGKVGDIAGGNQDADLTAVQQRLVAVGALSSAKSALETPTAIRAKYPDTYKDTKTNIEKAHIPETIKSIKGFQTKGDFAHTFWKTRKFAGQDMSTLTWVDGVIGTGDLSEFILSHYQSITYKFKDAAGADQTVSVHNFQKTGVTTDAAGIMTTGTANPATFTNAEFMAYGISELEARALQFVSKNEGKFNALNTYDRAVVSFGFIQFAGGSGGGTLPTMMANLKKDSPTVFKDKFQNYGIDVEYGESNGKITVATVVALDPASGKVLRGQSAEQYIRDMPKLLATFVDAGNNKDVQKAQVKTAVNEYVIPSRSVKFTDKTTTSLLKYKKDSKEVALVGDAAVKFSKSKEYADLPTTDKEALITFTLSGDKISDYLSSEKSRAVIIDQCINMGLGGGAGAISTGMKAYIDLKSETSKDNLKSADEVDILASIKPFAFVPGRVQKVIDDTSLSGT